MKSPTDPKPKLGKKYTSKKVDHSLAVTNAEGEFKHGDVVIAKYGKYDWPSIISQVYPKKVTINFLPLKNYPKVFTVPHKNILRGVTLNDEIPEGAGDELIGAYEEAFEVLKKGPPEKPKKKSVPARSAAEVSTKDLFYEYLPKEGEPSAERPKKNDVVLMLKTTRDNQLEYWPAKVNRDMGKNIMIFQFFPLDMTDKGFTDKVDMAIPFPVNDFVRIVQRAKKRNKELTEALLELPMYFDQMFGVQLVEKVDTPSVPMEENGMSNGHIENDQSPHEELVESKVHIKVLKRKQKKEVTDTPISYKRHRSMENGEGSSSNGEVEVKPLTEEFKNNIIEHVLSKNAFAHLESVVKQEHPSQRHHHFFCPSERYDLQKIPAEHGGFLGYDDLDETIDSLLQFTKDYKEFFPGWKTLDKFSWVMMVGVAELVIYALSVGHECSLEQAEVIFNGFSVPPTTPPPTVEDGDSNGLMHLAQAADQQKTSE
jgi:hypothetical protein